MNRRNLALAIAFAVLCLNPLSADEVIDITLSDRSEDPSLRWRFAQDDTIEFIVAPTARAPLAGSG